MRQLPLLSYSTEVGSAHVQLNSRDFVQNTRKTTLSTSTVRDSSGVLRSTEVRIVAQFKSFGKKSVV